MTTTFFSIQSNPIDLAGKSVLDYGIIGAVCVVVCWVAYRLYTQQQGYTEEWRKEAKEKGEAFMELSSRQLNIQEKQTELQERQATQTKDFYDHISRRVDEIPKEVGYIFDEIQKQRNHNGQNNQS